MTQKEALDILKLGHNAFLTGAAGSGKTYLLNQYISYLREQVIPVGITASTGIAATHMGGVTIHSWVGMGIRDEMTTREIQGLFKLRYLKKRLEKTKILIIDEISMLDAKRLDLVDEIIRAFRRNNVPFGGMQVIMCGDFFQLPPVVKFEKKTPPVILERSDNEAIESLSGILSSSSAGLQDDKDGQFVTKSKVWNEMRLQICYLDEQHRQDDRSFLRVLNDIRGNDVNEATTEYLSERLDKDTVGYTKPTRLFTHNKDVDSINNIHLDELSGELHEYMMGMRGNFKLGEILKKSCLAPELLRLKMGAQVMFVKNNREGKYVNGTIGHVIGFSTEQDTFGCPLIRTFDGAEIVATEAAWEVKDETGEEIAAITQIPLRLAWAITVHKSQGMSLDAAEVDLSKSFVPGMGYVALSRVRSLAGLKLMGMNHMALQINQDVLEMDKKFRKQSDEAVMYLQELGKEKKVKRQNDFLKYLKEK